MFAVKSCRLGRAVVIGGGRWARVLIPELINLLRDDVPVEIVSPSAAHIMQEWLVGHPALSCRPIRVCSDLPRPAKADEVAIAIVTNRPDDHFSAAEDLIGRGYHVLVEKPLTTDPDQAHRLIEFGHRSKRAVMAALEQMFAPYIGEFSSHLPFRASEIVGFDLEWGDPAIEMKYGEVKRPDSHTGIALDLVPHAWSLARAFLDPAAAMKMELVDVAVNGDEIKIGICAGNCSGMIWLSRSAPERRRRLRLRTTALAATLDFSRHPFTATFSNRSSIIVPERTAECGAIAGQIRFFLKLADEIQLGNCPSNHPAVGRDTVEHVELAFAIESSVLARRGVGGKPQLTE